MKPITLPTSPETRAALDKVGWGLRLFPGDGVERWILAGADPATVRIHPDGYLEGNGSFTKQMEFAAIMGLVPAGYRMIPEETATEYLAARTAFYGQRNIDDPSATAKGWIRLEAAEEVLAVALGGSRLMPPRPSEDGGLSPSSLAAIDDETAAMMSEMLDREPGFHQVNPINQRKAAAPTTKEE